MSDRMSKLIVFALVIASAVTWFIAGLAIGTSINKQTIGENHDIRTTTDIHIRQCPNGQTGDLLGGYAAAI